MDSLFGKTFDLDGDGRVVPEEELFGYTAMHHQQGAQTEPTGNHTSKGSAINISKGKGQLKEDDDHLINIMVITAPIIWVLCIIGMIKLWFSMVY